MQADHPHHDDVELSVDEAEAFGRLVDSTGDDAGRWPALPRLLPSTGRPARRHLDDPRLVALALGVAWVGLVVMIATLAVSLVASIAGLVVVVAGVGCAVRLNGRRDRSGRRSRYAEPRPTRAG